MSLEVPYWEQLHRVYKEVQNCLDYHISVQNMMCGKEQEYMINLVEKHMVQSICTERKGDNCQVHCRSKLACKDGPSTASSVNAAILIETARHS